MCNKHHRDAIEIPTDPVERKYLIEWLLDHPIWKRPQGTFKVPPKGIDWEKVFNVEISQNDWPEEVYMYGDINECVNFIYVYVNPATNEIDDDDSLNTKFQVWADCVQSWTDISEDENFIEPPEGWNDYNRWQLGGAWLCLECGGDSMEDCLLNLAVRVKLHFEDDGKYKKIEWCEGIYDRESDTVAYPCIDAGDGYCEVCGFAIE